MEEVAQSNVYRVDPRSDHIHLVVYLYPSMLISTHPTPESPKIFAGNLGSFICTRAVAVQHERTATEPPAAMMFEPNKRRKIGAEEIADWSAISGDILSLIASKINLIEDYVRFCAVCRLWYLFATDYYYSLEKEKLSSVFAPLLMLRDPGLTEEDLPFHPNPLRFTNYQYRKRTQPYFKPVSILPIEDEDEDDANSISKRTFYSFLSGNKFALELPEAAERRCWGSPFGWIITYGTKDLEFSIVNPFSRATFPLPSLRTLLAVQKYYPSQRSVKAILTASPDPPNCLAFLLINLCSGNDFLLAYAKPGSDEYWSLIEGPSDLNDIVYFGGKLYGCRGKNDDVVLIEPPRAVEFSPAPQVFRNKSLGIEGDEDSHGFYPSPTKYLVDLEGELCVIFRYAECYKTHDFKFFTINIDTKKWTWLWPLGDRCLFIGNNYTFAHKTLAPPHPRFNDSLDLKKNLRFYEKYYSRHFGSNCAYYIHDDDLFPNCLGVFDTYRGAPGYRMWDPGIINPPVWITPSLHFHKLEELDGPRSYGTV